VFDYPASQAALAVIRPGAPPVAERFELYVAGIELCNGYHELTDAAELRRRIESESQRRVSEGLPALPVSNRLLAAMEGGLPPCAGVALGFDRLVMLAGGARSIAEVIPFGFERA
jgi:lysyl-tRNA synthetase class 2